MAVAPASFNTSMDSISAGLMSLKEPRTWPSTRIRGEPEPSKLVPPRSTKVGAAPGLPEVWLTDRPATAPDKACAGLE